ncbi:MAG: carbohydrate kinase family protein [Candidatus Methanomethylicia archaeon]
MVLDVVCIGNVNIDVIAYINHIPDPDESTYASNLIISPGGSAANTAVGISRLGLKSGFIGRVGADPYGQLLIKSFIEEGVDVSCIEIDNTGNTGFVIVLVDRSSVRRIIRWPGVNLNLSPLDIDEEYIMKAKAIHVSGVKINIAYNASNLCDRYKLTFCWDPGLIAVKEKLNNIAEILSKTSILFISEVESKILTGTNNINEAIMKILNTGVKIVAVKAGAKGSYIAFNNNIHHIPAVRIKPVIDTTGAGDTYAAAFIVQTLRGKDPIQSARYASIASALKVRFSGARNIPRREEVDTFIKTHYNIFQVE